MFVCLRCGKDLKIRREVWERSPFAKAEKCELCERVKKNVRIVPIEVSNGIMFWKRKNDDLLSSFEKKMKGGM